ncbi:hypothetical protein DXG03_003280 [Asterophora parasitica]|uniref:Potassium transporter n=1 Tax=Asterophora parasitica TaxID=117018 RepID=A0A9P7KDF9_9AGAR|nr:hypothetical protein DXG03_003280 [Asterophora parasitica]
MVYTSEVIQGQIYVPAVNWALMVAVIVVVAAFSNLQNLTNAYGFAVATVMFSTSVLIAVHIFYIKQLPLVLSFVYMMIFGFVDALFWGASLKKVPHGAWVPLVIGIVLLSLMLLWTWAKSLEDAFDASNRKNLRHFIQQDFTGKGATYHLKDKTLDVPLPTSDIIKDTASAISRQSEPELESDPTYYYTSVFGEKSDSGEMLELERRRLQRIPTCAIFHKIAEGKGVPHTFIAFIRQWPALPRVVVFLSVCIVPFPRVPPGDRYAVTKVRTIEGFYGVTYYVGFRDDFNVQVNEMIDKICEIETQINPEGSAAVVETIRSVSHTATHIAPHYHVVSRKVHVRFRHVSAAVNWMRTFLIEDIYRRLATMFPETGKWLTNADEIMHVGINAVI